MLKSLDKNILYTSLSLIFVGLLIFFSASLKELDNLNYFNSVLSKQLFSILFGLVIMFLIATNKKISKTFLRYKSGYLFLGSIAFQLLLFIPSLGVSYKGALRWLNLGFFNFQPSELLKIAIVLFFAAVTTTLGKKIKNFKTYIYLLLTFVVPIFIFYVFIHDWGTMISILFSLGVILFISESRVLHIFSSILLGVVSFISFLWFFVPYGQTRLENFLNPSQADSLSSLYQNNQMMMTVGSGKIIGRGFGVSLQKFSGLLPEPLGDSIFAVFSEENGFIGSVFLIMIFLLLFFFILKRARNMKNIFEKKTVVGLATVIIFPAFFNIAATMSLVPLSGMPIPFVSQGGSIIIASCISLGIILFYTRKKN